MKKLNLILTKTALVGLFLAYLTTVGCTEKKSDSTTATPPAINTPTAPAKVVTPPAFNEDSAYQFLANQLKFGPRVPNTKAHDECAKYFHNFFKQHGGWIHRQHFEATAYDGKTLQLTNFIVSYNSKAPKRIIIASHWDSRPVADQDPVNKKGAIDGANDGASGVAIIMEIARIINANKDNLDVGVDLILFDGEDYGAPEEYKGPDRGETWCLGSKYWSEKSHKPGYSAYYGILLDMVGAPNARFAWDGVSRQYAPSVLKKIWEQAGQLGHGNYFVMENSPEIIDDHLYVNKLAKIPMVDIIHYDPSKGSYFADYWHTHKDDLSAIDKKTLKAVGETLVHVLYKETN